MINKQAFEEGYREVMEKRALSYGQMGALGGAALGGGAGAYLDPLEDPLMSGLVGAGVGTGLGYGGGALAAIHGGLGYRDRMEALAADKANIAAQERDLRKTLEDDLENASRGIYPAENRSLRDAAQRSYDTSMKNLGLNRERLSREGQDLGNEWATFSRENRPGITDFLPEILNPQIMDKAFISHLDEPRRRRR
jgi:hypothetical protein